MSDWGEVLVAGELFHDDRMQRLAADSFVDPQRSAQDKLGEWDHYNATGTHFVNGQPTLKGHPLAHSPILTGNWAVEELKGYGSGHLQQRSQEYRNALENVATEGPDGMNEEGLPHHQALEEAHNNLRVELQHNNRFVVPTIHDLSAVNHIGEQHAQGNLVNPRHEIGTGENSPAGKMAYRINCQRCVLAADARHRGYNVEARPRYYAPRGGSENDPTLSDHEIAGLWTNHDGSVPRYQDAEDLLPNGKSGPEIWDAMHDHIAKNWPPGARGMIAPTILTPGGDTARHVFSVSVHPTTGQISYDDPQRGTSNVDGRWREAPLAHGYPTVISQRAKREAARQMEKSGYFDTKTATKNINDNHWSALRFMRTDNLDLHPNSSKYLVDRGTAPDRAIMPPSSIT